MSIPLVTYMCDVGDVLPLASSLMEGVRGHMCRMSPLPFLPVGTELVYGDAAYCKVIGRVLLPLEGRMHAFACPLLKALRQITAEERSFALRKSGWSVAWITLSDKGYAGEREDQSGPLLGEMLAAHLPLAHSQGFLLPDDTSMLRSLLVELALGQGYDIVCTTGGTGVAPRDISPQTTASVLDYTLPGIAQAMMAASLTKTPNAVVSRAIAGVIGKSLVINFPGSRKAVKENMEAIVGALHHTLEKLHGDPSDCGA